MLNKQQAIKIVNDQLSKLSPSDDHFVIVEAGTIEKPYGWVFFYNSKTYLETGDYRFQLAGNGPVIVNKYDGSIEFLGTAHDVASTVASYEQARCIDSD